ncbi:hypothetical protein COCNU_scaffold004918G000010 [Cocos nucifera]|nr:hypothetical protein [Cocos nucifera]
MLTKELHAQKRKGKTLDESSKKAKVNAPGSATPTTAAIASKVAKGTDVIPTTEDEVIHLQEEKAVEVDRLTTEKVVKVEDLQEVLRKEELASARLKATLALEEERRKKVDVKAFIKEYELYVDKVAHKFLELDLSFLDEENPDEEVGPPTTVADPSPAKVTLKPSEPTIKALEPPLEPRVAKNAPTLIAAAPPEVENLE